jgi:hypothetical protein
MSDDKAQVVSLSELMSGTIGDSSKEEDRKKSNKELKDALEGKQQDTDFFDLEKDEKETLDNKPDFNSSEEEAPIEDKSSENPNEETTRLEEDSNEADKEAENNDVSPDEVTKSNLYKETLRVLYNDEIQSVVEVDDQGKETEVNIKDAIIDEEYFQKLVEAKQQSIIEEASENKISVKGLSKFAMDLVEIDRKGGNISELIRVKETYTDPLDQLDLDTEAGQETAVYLRMMASGQDEDSTKRLIGSYKQEGILEEKARLAEQELRNAVQDQVDNAKRLAEEEAAKTKELIKSYKKEIKDNLSSYQLNDTLKSKIVKLATDRDDNGRFELDKLYYQHRENPKDAADLAIFLLDKEEFVRQVTNRATEETKLTSATKLKIVKTTPSSTSIANGLGKNEGSDKNKISLSSLNET